MNSIKNATVNIVYDPKTHRMRARYENSWVRFPKELRFTNQYSFVVSELKPGRKSWIACGQISAKGQK